MYKIIRNINDKLYSSNTTGDYEVEYKLGEFVKPKIGKLFVFSELFYAHRFVFNSSLELEIYKCECTNVLYDTFIVVCNNELFFKQFWESHKLTYGLVLFPPENYCCVDEVKLIEKVS